MLLCMDLYLNNQIYRGWVVIKELGEKSDSHRSDRFIVMMQDKLQYYGLVFLYNYYLRRI